MAQINCDGEIGDWSVAGNLPEPLVGHSMFAAGNGLLVIGGYNGTGMVNKVHKAELKTDGTIDTWTELTPYPKATSSVQAVQAGDKIIVAGGGGEFGNLADTYWSTIDEAGNTGDWIAGPVLPQGVCCGSASVANGYMYVIGGYGNGYLNTVYASKLDIAVSTPIPTPPQKPATKILLIPGMLASWNEDAVLGCKVDDYNGDWKLAPFFGAIAYNPLIDALKNKDWDVDTLYYDWRKQISDNVPVVTGKLGGGTCTSARKVNIIGHSMGGLLSMAYLKNSSGGIAGRVLAAGAPFKGSAFSYPAWSAGDAWGNDLLTRSMMAIYLNSCRKKYPALSDREIIRATFPAVQNLLPTEDYLIELATGIYKPVTEMKAKNNWLPLDFGSPDYFGTIINTLSGNGKDTLQAIEVAERNKKDLSSGNWEDGRPVIRLTSNAGDGTILLDSSKLPGVVSRVINEDHVGLVMKPAGISQIMDFMGTPAVEVTANPLPKSLIIITSYPETAEVVKPDGNIIRTDQGLAVIANPQKGRYKIKTGVENDKQWIGIGRFSENGDSSWRSITHPDNSQIEEVE